MLLTKDNFEIGQVVACKHVGNKARYQEGMTLGTVITLSKKYVTVSSSDGNSKGIKFIIEDNFEREYLLQKSDISGNYILFTSEIEYLEYEEKVILMKQISEDLNQYSGKVHTLTIDQVRKISSIIKEG